MAIIDKMRYMLNVKQIESKQNLYGLADEHGFLFVAKNQISEVINSHTTLHMQGLHVDELDPYMVAVKLQRHISDAYIRK